MTSTERENPCCATTWPDVVISRMSRAEDSVMNVCSGAATQGSSAASGQATHRVEHLNPGEPRFASVPVTATSTKSLPPGAASTEPLLP